METIFKWNTSRKEEIGLLEKFLPENINDYTYIEPFVGSGALYWHLKPSESIINDIDEGVSLFYKALKAEDPDFLKLINKASHLYEKPFVEADNENAKRAQSEMYYSIRNKDRDLESFNNMSTGEKGARFWILNQLSYSGANRYNNKGEFIIGLDKSKTLDTSKLNDSEYTNLLQRTLVLNEDYSTVLKEASHNSFVFVDPPYYNSMESDNSRIEPLFDDSKQEEICETLKDLSGKWLIVVADTAPVRNIYKDFIRGSYVSPKTSSKILVASNYK